MKDNKKLITISVSITAIVTVALCSIVFFIYLSKEKKQEYLQPSELVVHSFQDKQAANKEQENRGENNNTESSGEKVSEDQDYNVEEIEGGDNRVTDDAGLRQEAKDKEEIKAESSTAPEVVYLAYHNDRYQFSIEYPDIFNDKMLPENNDGIIFRNADKGVELTISGINNVLDETVQTVYEEACSRLRNIIYQCQKDDWYVLSWTEDDKMFYKKVVVGTGSMNTFLISYPAKEEAAYDAVIEHLVETFQTTSIDETH